MSDAHMDNPETLRSKPRRRWRRCCCLGAVIAVSSVVLCAGCLSGVVYWFIPPYTWKGWIDNERKVPPKWHAEAPSDNARDVYDEALKLLPDAKSKDPLLAEWTKTVLAGEAGAIQRDLPRAKAFVEQYRGALQKLREGAGKRYLLGEPPDLATLFPSVARLQGLARLGTCSAMVAHVEGRDDDALRTLEDVTSLGANLDSGECPVQLLVGAACVAIQHRAAACVILRGHPSAMALRAHIARLDELRSRPSGLASSWAWDAAALDAAFTDLGMGPPFQRRSTYARALGESVPGPEIQAIGLKSGSSRAWIADRYARLIEEANKPAAARDLAAFAARTERDARERLDFLAADTAPLAPQTGLKYLSMHAQLAAEEVMCALELHQREHGAYPADLSALVPSYLPALPEDPFSGDPLVYRLEAEGYTLYSVGPNKVDDGGVSEKPRAVEPDQVFVGGTYLEP